MSSTTIADERNRLWRGVLISIVVNSERRLPAFCTSSSGKGLSARRGGLASLMRGKILGIFSAEMWRNFPAHSALLLFLAQHLQYPHCLFDVLMGGELGNENVADDAAFIDDKGDATGQQVQHG